MSFVQRAKDKLKKEYESYKYNKELENSPEIVRHKLNSEREQVRLQTEVARERQTFEREKLELKSLQRQNSTMGKLGTGIKEHLNEVRERNNNTQPKVNKGYQNNLRNNATLGSGRNIIYDQSPTRNSNLTLGNQPQGSRSLILSDEKSTRSVFGHSGGVTGNNKTVKPKKKTQGKTIVIKL